jgi:hypothetical protein
MKRVGFLSIVLVLILDKVVDRQIENFYNGQALVQLFHDGSRCIIDEEHRILARLYDCHNENRADIEQVDRLLLL